jgi:hypothetical protein
MTNKSEAVSSLAETEVKHTPTLVTHRSTYLEKLNLNFVFRVQRARWTMVNDGGKWFYGFNEFQVQSIFDLGFNRRR